MINCKEACEMISQELEHPLPLSKKVLLKAHLALCKTCLFFCHQTNAIHDLMAKRAEKEANDIDLEGSLSDEARDRFKAKLRKPKEED